MLTHWSVLTVPMVLVLGSILAALFGLIKNEKAKRVLQMISTTAAAAFALYVNIALVAGWKGVPKMADLKPFTVKLTETLTLSWQYYWITGTFAILVMGVLMFVLAYALETFKDDENTTPFYVLTPLLTAAIYMTLASVNLIALFFSWELMSFVAFLMLLYYDRTKEGGPWLYAFWSGVGAMSMIAGIFLFYLASDGKTGFGLFELMQTVPVLTIKHPYMTLAAVLLLGVPFMIKASIPPFHTWAPRTYGSTHPSVAAFFSAAYSKVGIFAMLMWVYMFVGTVMSGKWVTTLGANFRNMPTAFFILAILLAFGAVFTSLLAFAQKDAMYLLAYSSMGQLMYMVMALVLGIGITVGYQKDMNVTMTVYTLGFFGAIYHAYAHGVFEMAAYMALGAAYKRSGGETEFNKLGAYAHRMPVTFFMGFLAMLSTVSIPLMWGFASKYLIYQAALYGRFFVLSAMALIAGTASFLYAFRYIHGIWWGQPTKGYDFMHSVKEVSAWGIIIALVVMGLTVLGGAIPGQVLNFITGNAVNQMVMQSAMAGGPLLIDKAVYMVNGFSILHFGYLAILFTVGILVALLVYTTSGGSRKVNLDDFYNSAEPYRPEWQVQLIGAFYGPIERVIEPYFKVSIERVYNWLGGIFGWFASYIESWNTGDTRDYTWALAGLIVLLMVLWVF
ncbi:proton-conducting transporter transmembrane domain-containing protein [Zhurongbacter thermophilus]